jgi:hypothetical protein
LLIFFNNTTKKFVFLANEFTIRCPKYEFINHIFNCSIDIQTDVTFFQVVVDFGDGDTILLNGSFNEFKKYNISKMYSEEGKYAIKVNATSHQMNVQTEIFGMGCSNTVNPR